ncbi:hypothetical protein SLS62_011316 [Diatrype stigma]|uniref:Uncharacterized protein n=1 Tax=Diatrype stigma TaxID=117547 RepID=A0AAN9U3R0_9PEZI
MKDTAIVQVDTIDRSLKGWTEAWEAEDQERINKLTARLNKKIDSLSPSRRDFQNTPGCSSMFSVSPRCLQALGGLAQVGYRLQDVISDYEKHRGQWRLSVMMDLARVVTKIMFILKDILWRRSDNSESSRDDNPSPAAAVPNRGSDVSFDGTSDTTQPPDNNSNTQMIIPSADNLPNTSSANRYATTIFKSINKPWQTQSQSSSNTLTNGPDSSGSSATRLTPNSNPLSDISSGKGGEQVSSLGNGRAPSPARETKRGRERSKGEKIIRDGLKATNPCARCTKGGKTCMVPSDPQEMGTFKCGDCIKGQLGCSLTAMSPGRDDYDETHRRNCVRKEEDRKNAREKAQHLSREESPQNGSQEQGQKKRTVQQQCSGDAAIEREKGQAEGALEDPHDASLQDEPRKKKPARRTPLPTRPPKKAGSKSTSSLG